MQRTGVHTEDGHRQPVNAWDMLLGLNRLALSLAHACTCMHTQINTHAQRHTHRAKQKDRDIHREKDKNIKRYRERDRQKHMHRDIETET